MQQCLQLGLLYEIRINLAPVLLGGGVGLFDQLGDLPLQLERTRMVEAPGMTHLWYRVSRLDRDSRVPACG